MLHIMNAVIAEIEDVQAIGESSWPMDEWRGIEIHGFDEIKFATLHSLLTDQSFGEALAEYDPIFALSDDGPWVIRMPEEPLERLALMEDREIELIAEELAASEEFEKDGWPADAVQDFLSEFAQLAQSGIEDGKTMFLWVSQ